LTEPLKAPAAVVDFLFHPGAQFWADHHATTFLSDSARRQSRQRRGFWRFYDRKAGSCAMLLWKHLTHPIGKDKTRLGEMAKWAEKTDSARYDSVEEAILGDAPALRINFSLMRRADAAYCKFLVLALRKGSLADVAALPEVAERYDEAHRMTEAGLAFMKKSIRLTDGGVALFDVVASPDAIVSRYSPYYFYPEARYSIGVVRQPAGARITAMRNPWIEFPSVPLGEIFERYGGGGHQRVGALILDRERAPQAQQIVTELISEIRKQNSSEARAQGGV
jgi:hypothetical protein